MPGRVLARLRLSNLRNYSTKSYSQEGEDMILRKVFEGAEKGFYIDVGAHHPQRFSNTYYFYKQGWRGINIDAMPGSMKSFRRSRPGDINLEVPVSSTKQAMTFYMFDEPALNGFSERLAEQRSAGAQAYRIVSTETLETSTLAQILGEHLPQGQRIDFMSVDVEGLDYDVLLSNDWSRFRPAIVLVEILNSSLEELRNHEITRLLNANGYVSAFKTMNTVFFSLEDS